MQTKLISMKLDFYKQNNKWYVYIPELTQEECEMVCGADEMLDVLSNNENNISLNVEVADNESTLNKIKSNVMDDENFYNYIFTSYDNIIYNKPIWLCPVVKYVFGNYPDYFKIDIIK